MVEVNKYFIITYGCQMNLHESEKVAGMLESRGYIQASAQEDADIILINTCCIRQNAENRVHGNLGFFKKYKQTKKDLLLVIFGCMTQQKDAANELFHANPFINIIFGTHNIHKFLQFLDRAVNGERVLEIAEREQAPAEGLPTVRGSEINAWVNIIYGCNNFCSYCIVPFVRGRETCRTPNAILSEAESLIKLGYKEIALLGQNVNSYLYDDGHEQIDFASLLEKINSIAGEFRVRFLTSHPKDLSDRVIEAVKNGKKIAKHFHLPIQSGSDKILALMNRKYTASHYFERISAIKNAIPDAGITTDIIVGFPSETEEDFSLSLQMLEKARFNNLYSFVFSPRDGTEAAKLENNLSTHEAKTRLHRLQQLQQKIQDESAKAAISSVLPVLCETFCDKTNTFRGKASDGRQVVFTSKKCKIGDFVDVKITTAKNSNLIGEQI